MDKEIASILRASSGIKSPWSVVGAVVAPLVSLAGSLVFYVNELAISEQTKFYFDLLAFFIVIGTVIFSLVKILGSPAIRGASESSPGTPSIAGAIVPESSAKDPFEKINEAAAR